MPSHSVAEECHTHVTYSWPNRLVARHASCHIAATHRASTSRRPGHGEQAPWHGPPTGWRDEQKPIPPPLGYYETLTLTSGVVPWQAS